VAFKRGSNGAALPEKRFFGAMVVCVRIYLHFAVQTGDLWWKNRGLRLVLQRLADVADKAGMSRSI
jgi:hypothetical protein